jgi:hypothetical protein
LAQAVVALQRLARHAAPELQGVPVLAPYSLQEQQALACLGALLLKGLLRHQVV